MCCSLPRTTLHASIPCSLPPAADHVEASRHSCPLPLVSCDNDILLWPEEEAAGLRAKRPPLPTPSSSAWSPLPTSFFSRFRCVASAALPLVILTGIQAVEKWGLGGRTRPWKNEACSAVYLWTSCAFLRRDRRGTSLIGQNCFTCV